MSGAIPRRQALVILAAAGWVVACGPTPRQAKPVPIAAGRDECDYCRMRIEALAGAAEFIPDRGPARRFGEPGCLLAWLASSRERGTAFVVARDTGRWLAADGAVYVRGLVRTPMLYNLVAFDRVPPGTAGPVLRWEMLRGEGAPRADPG